MIIIIILNFSDEDMRFYSKTLRQILDSWPGKQRFGLYRFLPIYFILGAALEFSMINWHVGEVNFCKSLFISVCCTFTKLCV